MENNKKRVEFKVPEELYIEYKKCMIDQRTTPTADFIRHMMKVVEQHKVSEEK